MPYPPSYTEIYPAVEVVPSNVQMGWQQPQPNPMISNDGANIPIVSQTIEPPPYGTQQQTQQQQSSTRPGKRNFIKKKLSKKKSF